MVLFVTVAPTGCKKRRSQQLLEGFRILKTYAISKKPSKSSCQPGFTTRFDPYQGRLFYAVSYPACDAGLPALNPIQGWGFTTGDVRLAI